MEYLTLDDILAIRDAVARTAANSCALRAPSGLYAAMETPGAVLFGQELFETLPAKAGALLFGLIHNHPFWDGNKRIATDALKLFLERNNVRLDVDETTLRAYARDIARGTYDRDAVVAWVANHIEEKRVS